MIDHVTVSIGITVGLLTDNGSSEIELMATHIGYHRL
jgi:hypothetical protein